MTDDIETPRLRGLRSEHAQIQKRYEDAREEFQDAGQALKRSEERIAEEIKHIQEKNGISATTWAGVYE